MTTMRGRGGEDWSGDRRSGTGRYRDPRWSTRPEPTKDTSAKDTSAWHWLLMVPIVLPLSKTGIALGSIFVVTQVMGDFFVVKVMSGGQSASVVSALQNEIAALQYPPAAASAVILVIVVILMVSGILRVVDVRKELAS